MEVLSIILLSVLAAVVYGVLHDQVTARVCIEYFTVAHAPLLRSDSPTVLGLFWGVVATWWVGLPLGVLLAVSARVGGRQKRTARELVRPLSRLFARNGGDRVGLGHRRLPARIGGRRRGQRTVA